MSESKYFLTYDFKILYCPNINLKLSTKELNLDDLKFVKYNGNLNIIEIFFDIKSDTVNTIVDDVVKSKFGHELSKNDMEWIQKIEKALKVNSDIYENNHLMFNYYILKMRLAGFTEELAIAFTKNYFNNLNKKNEMDNLTSVKDSINILNNIIKTKEIWIGNNIYSYTKLEEEFLRTVLDYKKKLSFQFNFDIFKQDYLDIIQNSFIIYIYEYNKVPSYLVKNTKSILNNRSYIEMLLDIYNRIIMGILQYILNEDEYESFKYDGHKFLNTLIVDMCDTVKLYLNMLEESLK